MRVAGPADDAAALPDTARRCRLRQQDGGSRAAGPGAAGPEGSAHGAPDPLARGGLRDGARPTPLHHPHEDRRAPRRHAAGPRGGAAAGRWRLRRRQPRCARLRAADELRALQHSPRPCPWPRGLHQQDALRCLPRLWRAAGHLRVRTADRRDRQATGHRPDRHATPQPQARRRCLVLRAEDPVQRPVRMPGHRRARIGLAGPAGSRPIQRPAGREAARLRRRRHGPHRRPARIGCHRAHARGRQRAAEHRRGRYRPGQQHRAHADLCRGLAGAGRIASPSPVPTPTARPTTGAPPPAA